MDPLALLSDDGASGEEEGTGDGGPGGGGSGNSCGGCAGTGGDEGLGPREEGCPAPKRARGESGQVRFEELQLAGYRPAELTETAAYLRDAETQEERRAKARPSPPQSEHWPVEAGCEPPPPAPPPVTATCPRGGAPPAPWAHFGGREDEPAVGFPPELRGPLLAAGFSAPTPVQAHAWPALCAGRDLIAVAQTGSGKTLAYLLPVAAQLGRAAPGVSPAALVVAPTRELVCQIEQQAERFRKSAGLACAAVYGGAPKGPQLGALHAGPALVVATPGRLVDFLDTEQSSCSLSGVRFLIFDEADRMLDDGFDEQVRRVGREAAGARRQTAMFSATWPPTVQELARDFLQDPISIRVGHTDELSANADVAQDGRCSSRCQRVIVVLPGPRSGAGMLGGIRRLMRARLEISPQGGNERVATRAWV
ncbi:unnamed protein product [Prorocentrum cordatum]|uniref:Helicase ATP-binding domain-containing protein n=1 Tax=Prorocentrum cordatum TaxID=2364126 RepID=A0ABN9RZZ5_9DINO|nr:unnamed protein product [Polarella glacialis]